MSYTVENMDKTLVKLKEALEYGSYGSAYTLSNIYRELFRIGEITGDIVEVVNGVTDDEALLNLQVAFIDELCELLKKEFEKALGFDDYKISEFILKILKNLIYRKSELENFLS